MVNCLLISFVRRRLADIAHQCRAGIYIHPFAQLRAFSLIGSQSQVHLGLHVFGHSSNLEPVSVDKFV